MPFHRPTLPRVPVWAWRALMAQLSAHEVRHFNAEPIETVDYMLDIDYVGDGIRGHRLDVLTPSGMQNSGHLLPVYVYFHGGGWTSGDKLPLTKYCASQAAGGMVVVNVNYRMAGRFHMKHMLHDGNAALAWVLANIADFGGDPHTVVLAGDSAGGQIASLLAAMTNRAELAEHYDVVPAVSRHSLKGIVLHCGAVDFSVIFERGFIMGRGFIRMLLPGRGKGESLVRASRWLSPIEWIDRDFAPVLVTTSERDFFYRANLNYVAELRSHGVHVDTVIFEGARRNTEHTWQQNYRYPESQEVYRNVRQFVHRVSNALV
jgi:acetyl esterase/lipase